MSFNAIVWDVEASNRRIFGACFSKSQFKPNLIVVGRIFLSNLTQAPNTWRVQYRNRVLPRDSKLEDILWSDMQPIHLFKPRARAMMENEGQITLKNPSGETLQVTISAATIVIELKLRIFREAQQCPALLEFRGRTLTDDERVMGRVPLGSVVNFKFIEQLMPIMMMDTESVDLEGEQMPRRFRTRGPPGTRPGQIESWETFHVDNMGLTMYGHCPVPTCDSNVHESCADRVVVQAKYGVVRMTSGMDKFACPLCHTAGESVEGRGMFTPKNFNLMFARALFRFKKCGVNEPVKAVLMESLSTTREYTTFDSSTETSNYEVIEILTVGPNSSPYYCVKCDIRCWSPGASWEDLSISEVLLSCGHAYHSGCLSEDKSCIVCAGKLIENISVLVAEDDDSSTNTSQAAENEGHGHDLFSDFFPREGDSSSIFDTACLKIALIEFQEICREFFSTIGPEQMAVDAANE